MHVRASELSHREMYALILNGVVPRPIAWVSTLSATGQPNLAPFSFFNCVCVDPPLLAFAPGLRAPKEANAAHGEPKDTLRNVRETKEFVVNVVPYALREAMNITSGEYDHTVNEFDMAKLTPQPSQLVRPPRVSESPISFECKLYQILDFSTVPTSSSLVIGEVVAVHVDDAHMEGERIDGNSLDLIGRMGGAQYTRTTDRFEMIRPKVG